MLKQIYQHQLTTFQGIFFDKHKTSNFYQCPQIHVLFLRVEGFENRSSLYKLLILFYLILGQRPSLFFECYNVRGIRKQRLKFFFIKVRRELVLLFIQSVFFRQLPASTYPPLFFSPTNSFVVS